MALEKKNQIRLKFVKPHFARPLIPHINTKPNVGSDFVDRKKSEINILFEAECERYKVLQI